MEGREDTVRISTEVWIGPAQPEDSFIVFAGGKHVARRGRRFVESFHLAVSNARQSVGGADPERTVVTRHNASDTVRREAIFRGIMRNAVIAQKVNARVRGADPHAVFRIIHPGVACDGKVGGQPGEDGFGGCEAYTIEADQSALRTEPDVAFRTLPDTLDGAFGEALLGKPNPVGVLGKGEAWVERSRSGGEGGQSQRQ